MSSNQFERLDYVIRGSCPECNTLVTLNTESLEMLMFICEGCGKGVAYFDGKIFIVSSKFLEKINRRYKTKDCGRILEFNYQTRYKTNSSLPTEVDMKGALDGPEEDCLTTINKLDSLKNLGNSGK